MEVIWWNTSVWLVILKLFILCNIKIQRQLLPFLTFAFRDLIRLAVYLKEFVITTSGKGKNKKNVADIVRNFMGHSLEVYFKQVSWKSWNMKWSPCMYLKGRLSRAAFGKPTKRPYEI